MMMLTHEVGTHVAYKQMVPDAEAAKKDLFRGIIVNVVAIAILFTVTLIEPTILVPVLTSFGLQMAVFLLHGLPYSSEKYYDLSGSATHFCVVAISLTTCPAGASAQQVLFGLLSTVWLVRLGTFLYLRILRDGRDERFTEMKKVPLRFMGAWTIQSLWVVMVQMPVILITRVPDSATPASYAVNGFLMLVWIGAFLIEATADVQKSEFRQNPENRNKFIASGLWAHAQHPNYFGEIMMWVAAAAAASVFGVATGQPKMHYAWLSPLITCLLLLKVSGVPMLRAANEKKWGTDPGYQHYLQTTNLLVPWPC